MTPIRQTKIIATIGPASSEDAIIRDLVAGGVDMFRLNFSHGTHDSHGEVIARVRRAAIDAGRPIAILQDLSGPKIRTGALRGGHPIVLAAGGTLVIEAGDFDGEPGRVSTTYAALAKSVSPGDVLLLDDGRIQLRVEDTDGQRLRTVVVDGGSLGEHKGINAPGVLLPSAGLTPKDAEDLAFGVRMGVDVIALSFVQSAADLRQAREALRQAGAPHLPLMAKLERPEAIAHLGEILDASDAVMIARGDLGLELPLERVPRVQKDVTRQARACGVPVVVATQVFESMRSEPRPTRAEVSDAANAVDDRVDAIMLAGETAIGAFPARAVQTLDRVIREAESDPPEGLAPVGDLPILSGHGRALCEAAITLAARGRAAAIIAITRGGKTARVLSALRPSVPILAATDSVAVARRLALTWGVVPVLGDVSGEVREAAARIGQTFVARDLLAPGATVVLVSVTPDLKPGPSNVLTIQNVRG